MVDDGRRGIDRARRAASGVVNARPRRDTGPAYLLLYVPYAIAAMLSGSAAASFLSAWLGSFAIIALSFSGIIKPLPRGRTVVEQVLRPIVLTQIIFVTYTALTSIFTF